MLIRRSTFGGLVLGLSLVVWSLPVLAMDAATKEAVRKLANDGASEFDAAHYDQALGKFELAYESAQVPAIGLWLAQTHAKLGHLVVALEHYRQVLNLEHQVLDYGSTLPHDSASRRRASQGLWMHQYTAVSCKRSRGARADR